MELASRARSNLITQGPKFIYWEATEENLKIKIVFGNLMENM
jgi:hypothetical protein